MGVQEIRENGFGSAAASGRVGAGARRAARPVLVEDSTGTTRRAGFGSIRLRLRPGMVPESTRGRVVGGIALLCVLATIGFVVDAGRRALVRDERFVVPSSASIQIEGNSHVSRAQLLSVFGQDVERNVLTISLEERRAELERLPWVEHATVMRLLPNKLRVAVVERTPVAFVRQGRHVGLVDGHGVLLDLGEDASERYSFPVVTGINAEEPLSVRAARMKIFRRFADDLDGSGEKIMEKLSEVDLSNPEDVKALISEDRSDLLVHFGDRDYLERYKKFQQQLPIWQQQYPKLASADMRYERQVVLEMQPGSAVTAEVEAANMEPAAAKRPVVAAKLSAAKKFGPDRFAANPRKTFGGHGVSAEALSGMSKPHYPAGADAGAAKE